MLYRYSISHSACHSHSRWQKAGEINKAKNNANILNICTMRGHIFYKRGVDSRGSREDLQYCIECKEFLQPSMCACSAVDVF